jgi:hypothetical protein
MALSVNICDVQNLGTRRYVCYEHKQRFAYIDVLEKEKEVLAFVQLGIHGSIIESGSPYKAKTENESVQKAFDYIKTFNWTKYPEVELLVPDVLKDYQLNLF